MRDRPEVSYRRCRFATGGGDGAREARGKNENGGTHRVDGVALTVTYHYYAGMDEGGGAGAGVDAVFAFLTEAPPVTSAGDSCPVTCDL